MRRRLFNWQGQRFLYLGLEGEPGLALPRQSSELFARAGAELAALGFSLERNTVRTRVFGRSGAARTAGSAARTQALVGPARAAGSSYVAADPVGACADILPRAEALLRETGCAWGNVVRVSFFLHRDQDPDALLAAVAALAPVPLAHAELELVEGFSRPGKLIEIESRPGGEAVNQGSVTKRRLPAGASVLLSKVRASSAPASSMVTTMRSPAPAIATTRAPLGSVAVTSGRAAALPSPRETR